MEKFKRRPFFIKDNFQAIFIAGFILLLLIEIILASLWVYNLSIAGIEEQAFKSHIIINNSAQIIKPAAIRVNIYFFFISVLLACVITTIAYFKSLKLFGEIIKGLENLKDNKTSFRINSSYGKKSMEVIQEFNSAARHIDNHIKDTKTTLDLLLNQNEIKEIEKLHNKLSRLISQKAY